MEHMTAAAAVESPKKSSMAFIDAFVSSNARIAPVRKLRFECTA